MLLDYSCINIILNNIYYIILFIRIVHLYNEIHIKQKLYDNVAID